MIRECSIKENQFQVGDTKSTESAAKTDSWQEEGEEEGGVELGEGCEGILVMD